MDNSWIKNYRKLLESKVYTEKDSDYFKIWSTLLLMASYGERDVELNGRSIHLKPGQILLSVRDLSRKARIEHSKVKRILKYFQSDSMIWIGDLHSCSLISIVNWHRHQNGEIQNDSTQSKMTQEMTQERSKSDSRESASDVDSELTVTQDMPKSDSTNDYFLKNKRRSKKNNIHSTNNRECGTFDFVSPSNELGAPSANAPTRKATRDEILSYCASLHLPESDADYLFDHWEGCGWRNGKNPIKDWRATVRAWKGAGHLPSQKNGNGRHQFESRIEKNLRLAKEYDERLRKDQTQ